VYHSSWKAFIKLSLVSIPVRAYSTGRSSNEKIGFNQLHDACHSRIRYQKTCPVHGEVPNSEIVKGYEYAKGEYVVVDPDELERLQTAGGRSVHIHAFTDPKKIDPLYFSGKTYYLLPDGPAGEKPYALLYEGMVEEKLFALAQVVLSGREELMVLRPVERLLTLSALHYKTEIRQPASFNHELSEQDLSAKELELTRALIQATTAAKFDLGNYRDLYAEKLAELIQAKVAGKEIVVAPTEEAPPVINLMDALRESIAQTTGQQKPKGRKMASSSRQRRPARRKKTG